MFLPLAMSFYSFDAPFSPWSSFATRYPRRLPTKKHARAVAAPASKATRSHLSECHYHLYFPVSDLQGHHIWLHSRQFLQTRAFDKLLAVLVSAMLPPCGCCCCSASSILLGTEGFKHSIQPDIDLSSRLHYYSCRYSGRLVFVVVRHEAADLDLRFAGF
jgi:hypothetical protein